MARRQTALRSPPKALQPNYFHQVFYGAGFRAIRPQSTYPTRDIFPGHAALYSGTIHILWQLSDQSQNG